MQLNNRGLNNLITQNQAKRNERGLSFAEKLMPAPACSRKDTAIPDRAGIQLQGRDFDTLCPDASSRAGEHRRGGRGPGEKEGGGSPRQEFAPIRWP